ncbi:DinB family protein [Nocardia blacklockiae]|uniref:DinB family protein n=1 Tax=Nocardia blacklockiae TaxID=480036 RepID=UPI0018959B02|nr:DinB family protein [Nocardia blacklockiae]MBF6172214.1 DinB family protein [Nocardia blacklockiae]
MSWTAPPIDRPRLRTAGDERALLQSWLDHHRYTLLAKCAGLSAAQLRLRSAEPSTLSLLGLVRHMTDVERSWFRIRAAGQDLAYHYSTADNVDGEFDDVDIADAAADLERFRAELASVDEAVAGIPLEHTFVHPRSGEVTSLRWVYLHLIEEYARHNGHADLLRERIDGVTGA